MSAGDPIFATDYALAMLMSKGRPLVRIRQTVSQTIAHATNTPLTFDTEDWDDLGFHSGTTNTDRITPTVAGVYRLSAGCWMAAPGAGVDYTKIRFFFTKNGTAIPPGNQNSPDAAATNTEDAIYASCQAAANGTTDFFQIVINQSNSGTASKGTSVSPVPFQSVFECVYDGPVQ